MPRKLEVGTIARIDRLIARPKLDPWWHRATAAGHLLLVAPPGYGKTAFLLSQLARFKGDLRWYAIDEGDRDPEIFARGIDPALRPVDGTLQRVLVIEDLHLLPRSEAHGAALSQVLREFPGTVVLSSRESPAIPTARLETSGRLVRMGVEQLRFEAAEVRELLALRLDSEIAERVSRRVLDLTDGWPAGIELLLSGEDAPIESTIERAHTIDHVWERYFSEEVIDRVDPELRAALLDASLLPRFDAALLDRLLGRNDGAAHVSALVERELFVQRLEAGGTWYRFLPIFRRHLRERFGRERGEVERKRLSLRAAELLIDAGLQAEAAAAFLTAGERSRAIACLERLGRLDGAPSGDLLEVARQLAPAELTAAPWALLALARWHELRGDWSRVLRLCARGMRAGSDRAARLAFVDLRARILMRRGRHAEVIRTCARALRALRASRASRGEEPTDTVEAKLLTTLGISRAELGHLDRAAAALGRVLQLAERVGDAAVEARALYLLASNVHLSRGDVIRAEEAARRSLERWVELDDAKGICHATGVLAEIKLAQEDLTAAAALATDALHRAELLGYRMIEGYCHLVLGGVALRRGQREEARRNLARAERIGDDLEEVDLSVLSRLRSAEAEPDRAESLIAEAAERARAVGATRLLSLCERTRRIPPVVPIPQHRGAVGSARSQDALDIFLLGPIVIERGGETWGFASFTSRRALRLFLFLAMRRFTWVPREEIQEALWPGVAPERSLNQLKQSAHLLRRLLEPAGRRVGYLAQRHEAYRLEPEWVASCDLTRFEEACRAGVTAFQAGERERAACLLREAIQLYRGDFAAELPYEEFAVDARARLALLRHRAAERLERLGRECEPVRGKAEPTGPRIALSVEPSSSRRAGAKAAYHGREPEVP